MAVFAALIVLSLAGLGWYLVAGHSWNVAASNIDDTFGSMEGYTAIVYAGTAEPEPSSAAGASGAGKPSSPEKGSSSEDAEERDAEGASQPASEPAAEDAPSSGNAPDSQKDVRSSDDASDSQEDALSSGNASDSEKDTSASSASFAGSTARAGAQSLSVAEVRESYEDKDAAVFELDTVDPSRYSEGVILKRGAHRFGVLSVSADEGFAARRIKGQVAYFAEHEVDFVVVVTDNRELLEDVEGVDIVVATQDEDPLVMGETVGSTFYVDAPEKGKVGAILISPSNVVSAKVIEDL